MDTMNLRRKDTTKGPPLRILSLDGGGVRGYSMLILLQELMHRTHVEIYGRAPRPHEIPKPCDHFDLIAGTGTGGLIAIMLGRLRMDLETCKEVYIRMTKRVFETDKTFAGIPYKSTLFKASKLEEAIRDCVREHTIFDDEGNDTLASAVPMTPATPQSALDIDSAGPMRSSSTTSRASLGSPYNSFKSSRGSIGSRSWGNANALLYDVREARTKTAVTAVYRGTPLQGKSIFLRSYDSRREPAPEVNCTIWQAGRATCATGLAFKPIQIGQSVFIDEGAGKYNPAPQVLDEAVLNEYPTREIGVFVSIGTGRRPAGTAQKQSEWWEGFMGGSMGDFAEARRRLISKIEGCEETHQYMIREHLACRGVNPDCYFRLNVEVGVGEFGMNEWSRLTDISTNTRHYLAKDDVRTMNMTASANIARIHRTKVRWERANSGTPPGSRPYSFESTRDTGLPLSNPMAVELPAQPDSDTAPTLTSHWPQKIVPQPLPRKPSYDDKMLAMSSNATSDELPTALQSSTSSSHVQSHQHAMVPLLISQDITSTAAPNNPHHAPPPLPPKTPLGIRNIIAPSINLNGLSGPRSSIHSTNNPSGRVVTPYPVDDVNSLPEHNRGRDPSPEGPPPVVSLRDKPQYGIRYTH